MAVEISNFNRMDDGGAVLAEFSVYMPKMFLQLNKVRVIRSKKGDLFVTAPAFKKEEDWIPYFRWGDAATKAFNLQVMDAVKPLLEGEPPPKQENVDHDIPF